MQNKFKNIVILTGAGISAPSGLKTFRASDGLWEGHRIEDVATPEAYARNPDLVNEFYNARRKQLKEVEPNAAHYALARLEHEWPFDVLIVTQNVDDLHERAFAKTTAEGGKVDWTPRPMARPRGAAEQSEACVSDIAVDDLHERAGSKNLIHMHGELLKSRCTETFEVCGWHDDILPDTISPYSKEGTLRPHIVWFGEMPLEMDRIYDALRKCDLFISIGTSGNVYPAAGFVQEARRAGAYCIELNLEPSLGAKDFHESINGNAIDIVPKFVEGLLNDK